MNIFRVHFTWKEKQYELKAHSLDKTHPYLVSIKDLVLPEESSVLINPADDELRKNFSEVRQLMLPFHPGDPAPSRTRWSPQNSVCLPSAPNHWWWCNGEWLNFSRYRKLPEQYPWRPPWPGAYFDKFPRLVNSICNSICVSFQLIQSAQDRTRPVDKATGVVNSNYLADQTDNLYIATRWTL